MVSRKKIMNPNHIQRRTLKTGGMIQRSRSVNSESPLESHYGLSKFEEYVHYTEDKPVVFMYVNKNIAYPIFSLTLLDEYILCTGIQTISGTYTYDLVKRDYVGKCFRTVSAGESPRCLSFDNIVKYKLTLDSDSCLDVKRDLYNVYSKRFNKPNDDLFPVYIKCPIPLTAFAFMDIVPKIYDIIKDQ